MGILHPLTDVCLLETCVLMWHSEMTFSENSAHCFEHSSTVLEVHPETKETREQRTKRSASSVS